MRVNDASPTAASADFEKFPMPVDLHNGGYCCGDVEKNCDSRVSVCYRAR